MVDHVGARTTQATGSGETTEIPVEREELTEAARTEYRKWGHSVMLAILSLLNLEMWQEWLLFFPKDRDFQENWPRLVHAAKTLEKALEPWFEGTAVLDVSALLEIPIVSNHPLSLLSVSDLQNVREHIRDIRLGIHELKLNRWSKMKKKGKHLKKVDRKYGQPQAKKRQ
jgi:hypothetical protein